MHAFNSKVDSPLPDCVEADGHVPPRWREPGLSVAVLLLYHLLSFQLIRSVLLS